MPDLSPATSTMAFRCGSNAKATRQTPLSAWKRNSFMLAWHDPFKVSTRGRPSAGPSVSRSLAWASSSSCTEKDSASNSESKAGANSTVHAMLDYASGGICCQGHIVGLLVTVRRGRRNAADCRRGSSPPHEALRPLCGASPPPCRPPGTGPGGRSQSP